VGLIRQIGTSSDEEYLSTLLGDKSFTECLDIFATSTILFGVKVLLKTLIKN
jgi:hypothetical protein|tara:strand:+ start:163 stop:318 length:156 start_codon:yes stop_codon:yes gene_type:complete